jgi:hypothetical protein
MAFTSKRIDQRFTPYSVQMNGVWLHYGISGKDNLVVNLLYVAENYACLGRTLNHD